jgi:hypothetical protein
MNDEQITADQFESACAEQIAGWLWDESYNPDYQEKVSLTIREMRHIANLFRTAQGLPHGVVRKWSEGLPSGFITEETK